VRSCSLVGIPISILAILLAASPSWSAPPPVDGADFFEKEVRPIVVEKCGECHGNVKPKAKLKLISRADILQGGDEGPAIVPGKPDASLIIKAVRYQSKLQMPPSGKLTDRQIENLERWVKMGAPWPGDNTKTASANDAFKITDKNRQFWSFQPIKAPAIPTTRDNAWAKSDIDRFILAGLESKKITPAKPADKRTLLRRATFDLIGLPPTPAEMEAFLADDSPQAFARVVERLLASPLYGERWGRHWLDVVRYADARDLIQLPPQSDFREAWLYRDWVVNSFNRDLPYTDFIRNQIAGDLLPAATPGGFNKDGVVATGMLAIADFVPGDVDKNVMIADYVNDQIDVVGRTVLGLSVACARCHDHKFDPISMEDYYGLAGIFFSTRIIPEPSPGNTPLVRVPLISPAEKAKLEAQAAADARRRTELEKSLPEAGARAYRSYLSDLLTKQSAQYVLAAVECRKAPASGAKAAITDVAKRRGLHPGMLAEWVAFLDRIEKQTANYPQLIRELASGKLSDADLERAATSVQQTLSTQAKHEQKQVAERPGGALVHFRADDPGLTTDANGKVTLWPNRAGFSGDAAPPNPANSPIKTSTKIGDHTKIVLRFDGQSVLEAPYQVPPSGTLFVVFQSGPSARDGERIVGWEDSSVGRHGLGLMTGANGLLQAILRKNGKSGDLTDRTRPTGFEMVTLSWGPAGTTMRRGKNQLASKTVDGVSCDPGIGSLKIGGPGSGSAPRFHGDIAELRVYSQQMSEDQCKKIETELRETWYQLGDPKKVLESEPVGDLYAYLISPRGPFWPAEAERAGRLPAEVRKQIESMRAELAALKTKPAPTFQQAVAAQDGGPKGSRHEGFKDAQIFLRGDPAKLGKTVPRAFPKILTGERPHRIASGSGRRELADWLTQPDNPLPARVMVNRIWQHHFGEGLVRTPNDFGERGERPTHPELLDYLARKFIDAGWSIKAMHRLIMLSAVYQQASVNPGALTADPENRFFGRMNRQRLEAEAIRDSLLAVSGKLDTTMGGAAFTDLATPRRTIYLMAARTGANTSDFGRLFDRADPTLIVGQRGQSVVAPQALFFLNDPFVSGIAKSLAARVLREAPPNAEGRIRYLYALALSRPPTKAETEIGTLVLSTPAMSGKPDPLERYCLLVLCTNEFLYVD
jgi:hypothetical protein